MRVLFLTGEFPPMQGGVGDCTHEIAKALAALGVDVRVVTSARARGGTWSIPVEPIIEKWDWSSYRVLAQVMHRFDPEIIHTQYQTGAYGMHPAINFYPLIFRRLAPFFKFAITYHDLKEPYLFPKAGWVRQLVTFFPGQISDACIATNEEDYLRLSTLDLNPPILIPIGSNIPGTPPANFNRAAWRKKYGVGANDLLLCYFGFLNESKGGETLIRALAGIPDAKLLMIGGQVGASDPTNVAYLSKIKSLIPNLQLTDRVLWTDYTPPDQVTANFLASDVCVLPYRDGASYQRGTLMAALAHAMPIVTTTGRADRGTGVGGLPVLRDGENVLLVEPDNPHVLAEAIQRAGASPELRAKLSRGAREVADFFTWNRIAEKHLELYEKLTGQKQKAKGKT